MHQRSPKDEYRCLIDILTCPVCHQLVQQAHTCPSCSKFYCFTCISQQLVIEERCLNCSQHLNKQMLVNCQEVCSQLANTLEKVRRKRVSSVRIQQKSALHCVNHNLQKNYYCQTCQIPLCSDCSVLTQTHRGHKFIKLNIMRESYQTKMNDMNETLRKVKETVLKRIQSVKKHIGQGKRHQTITSQFQYSLRALGDDIRRKQKNRLQQGEASMNFMIGLIDQLNIKYQGNMKILKNSSKGKFVQQHYPIIQNELNKIVADMPKNNIFIQKFMAKTQSKQNNESYVSPTLRSYVFSIDNFSAKVSVDFFYTEPVTTAQGLKWRLKIYPQGMKPNSNPDIKPRLVRTKSRTQQYISIFIQFVQGASSSLQKHQLIVVNHSNHSRNMVRQFESEFQLGQCWGYQNYMRLSQLYQQGFYDHDEDLLEIVLKIAPANYYQACLDQHRLLQQKRQQINKNSLLLAKITGGLQLTSTNGSIQSLGFLQTVY